MIYITPKVPSEKDYQEDAAFERVLQEAMRRALEEVKREREENPR